MCDLLRVMAPTLQTARNARKFSGSFFCYIQYRPTRFEPDRIIKKPAELLQVFRGADVFDTNRMHFAPPCVRIVVPLPDLDFRY